MKEYGKNVNHSVTCIGVKKIPLGQKIGGVTWFQ